MVISVPFASPAQQRWAHAEASRGNKSVAGFAEHGDAYMRESKKKGVKHGPYSEHRTVRKQASWGNAAGAHGRRLEDVEKSRRSDAAKLALLPAALPLLAAKKIADVGPKAFGRRLADEAKYAGRKAKSAIGKDEEFGKRRGFDPEESRQRRVGAYEAGGLGGAGTLGYFGGRGVTRSTRLARTTQGIVHSDAEKLKDLHGALKGGVLARKKHLALLGGAITLAGGTGALHHHEMSRRGTWD